jgi:predicted transcriptional regulator
LTNYRGRIDIIADILKVAEATVKKTQIMYRANLSYTVLQRYLAELTDASLIIFDSARQSYGLTDKGREYLVLYKEYSRANKHIERRLTTTRVKKGALDKLCVACKSKPSSSNHAMPDAFKEKIKGDCVTSNT